MFFSFGNPLFGEVKQLKSDVATYNIALDNSTELQKTRDSLIEIYKNVKTEDKERLAHFLPSSIGNIELILEIEKIANLHGMPIKNITFDTRGLEGSNKTDTGNVVVAGSDPSSFLPYGIFPMDFVIEGKYDTFLLFLKDLEHNLRLVDVKSITFSTSSPAAGTTALNNSTYDYTLKVETYWLK